MIDEGCSKNSYPCEDYRSRSLDSASQRVIIRNRKAYSFTSERLDYRGQQRTKGKCKHQEGAKALFEGEARSKAGEEGFKEFLIAPALR